MTTENPLRGKFRTPKIYIKLPSRNVFTDPKLVKTSITGEIGVMAMTAMDEMHLRNPDALLNGEAIERTIKSCVPNILDVRALPYCDIEALMLAIKFATYGDELKLDVKCPVCEFENKIALSIRGLIESTHYHDDAYVMKTDDGLEIRLKPYTFAIATEASIMAYENSKYIQIVSNQTDSTDEEKISEINQVIQKFANFAYESMAKCILSITDVSDPDNKVVVTNEDHIKEFITNIDATVANAIRDKISEINKVGVQKEVDLTCTNESYGEEKKPCGHTWKLPIGLDPSDFFDISSSS